MSRTAEQMSLMLSIANSLDIQRDRDRAEAYAQEQHDRAEALSAENARLRDAHETDQAHIKALEKEKKAWERSYKRLKAERDQLYQARLSDAAHPLHAECKQLREEVDSLRATLFERVWRELEGLRRPGSLGNGPSKADLTQLLTIAHPDKWSQGQPASELAHEVTVVVNKLRQGVQP